jgi:hypothetical protein
LLPARRRRGRTAEQRDELATRVLKNPLSEAAQSMSHFALKATEVLLQRIYRGPVPMLLLVMPDCCY